MPINDYFESYLPRSAERNTAYIGKMNEENQRRQLAAIRSAKTAFDYNRKIGDEEALALLRLHLKGYGNESIALMKNVPERSVFRALQPLLARYVAGARDRDVLNRNSRWKLQPIPRRILDGINNRGEEVEEWSKGMMRRGLSRQVVNRLIGVRPGKVSVKAALMVAEYFQRNLDDYFVEMAVEEDKK